MESLLGFRAEQVVKRIDRVTKIDGVDPIEGRSGHLIIEAKGDLIPTVCQERLPNIKLLAVHVARSVKRRSARRAVRPLACVPLRLG